jgi:hypothetical protein
MTYTPAQLADIQKAKVNAGIALDNLIDNYRHAMLKHGADPAFAGLGSAMAEKCHVLDPQARHEQVAVMTAALMTAVVRLADSETVTSLDDPSAVPREFLLAELGTLKTWCEEYAAGAAFRGGPTSTSNAINDVIGRIGDRILVLEAGA